MSSPEQLRERYEEQEAPKTPESSQELQFETQKISEEVEAIDVNARVAEHAPTRTSEQWSGGGQGGTTATAQDAATTTQDKDDRIVLPTSVKEMQKLVRKEIKTEMTAIMKQVSVHSRSGSFDAAKVNKLVAQLRRLKEVMSNLLEMSRDKLKEVLFSLVPRSKFVDPEEE